MARKTKAKALLDRQKAEESPQVSKKGDGKDKALKVKGKVAAVARLCAITIRVNLQISGLITTSVCFFLLDVAGPSRAAGHAVRTATAAHKEPGLEKLSHLVSKTSE